MVVFTASAISTLMLAAALSLSMLSTRSVCQSIQWQNEIQRVAAELKSRALPSYALTPCGRSKVNWYFQGSLP